MVWCFHSADGLRIKMHLTLLYITNYHWWRRLHKDLWADILVFKFSKYYYLAENIRHVPYGMNIGICGKSKHDSSAILRSNDDVLICGCPWEVVINNIKRNIGYFIIIMVLNTTIKLHDSTLYFEPCVLSVFIWKAHNYGGLERTWCKYILTRYSDLTSRY